MGDGEGAEISSSLEGRGRRIRVGRGGSGE
jgi:hypothetical protein